MNGAVPLLAVGGAQTDGCLKRNLCRLSYSSTFRGIGARCRGLVLVQLVHVMADSRRCPPMRRTRRCFRSQPLVQGSKFRTSVLYLHEFGFCDLPQRCDAHDFFDQVILLHNGLLKPLMH